MTEEEFKKAFGKNIKSIRVQKKLKQEVLANNIGIAPTNLSRIENGKDFVKASTIVSLCKILEISPEELFKIQN